MVRFSFGHIKVSVFCIGLCLTIWMSYACIDKYLQFNPITKVDMVNSKDTLAPALVLCPDYHSAYNQTRLLEFGISDDQEYKNGGAWKGNTAMDEKRVYNLITYDLQNLIEKLEIKLSSGLSHIFIGQNLSSLVVFQIFTKSLGCCFEIDIGQFETSAADIQITTKHHLYIYINLPGQFSSDDSRSKLEAFIGDKLYIDVTYEVLKMKYEKTCQKYPGSLTYDKCIFSAIEDSYKTKLGCTVPFILSNLSICRNHTLIKQVN